MSRCGGSHLRSSIHHTGFSFFLSIAEFSLICDTEFSHPYHLSSDMQSIRCSKSGPYRILQSLASRCWRLGASPPSHPVSSIQHFNSPAPHARLICCGAQKSGRGGGGPPRRSNRTSAAGDKVLFGASQCSCLLVAVSPYTVYCLLLVNLGRSGRRSRQERFPAILGLGRCRDHQRCTRLHWWRHQLLCHYFRRIDLGFQA